MDQTSADALAHQLHLVRDLYAELLLLLTQSIQEDPLEEAGGGFDGLIDPLMERIGREMADFHRAIERARQQGCLPAELAGEIETFQQQLRDNLPLLATRLLERSAELGDQRDALKNKVNMVQKKRKGARGYHSGQAAKASLRSKA